MINTRRLMLICGLLLLKLLWPVSAAHAETPIPNNTKISGDETWTLAGSPYIVEGLVMVDGTDGEVATLNIEPGVEVRFKPNGDLRVGSQGPGALVAIGVPDAPIIFTTSARFPLPGNWMELHY